MASGTLCIYCLERYVFTVLTQRNKIGHLKAFANKFQASKQNDCQQSKTNAYLNLIEVMEPFLLSPLLLHKSNKELQEP